MPIFPNGIILTFHQAMQKILAATQWRFAGVAPSGFRWANTVALP